MRYLFVLTLAAAVVAVGAAGGTAAQTSTALVVNNSNADVPGSFRRAIANANTSPSIDKIVFKPGLAPILLAGPSVAFTGSQSLDILGSGAVLDGAGVTDDALVVTGGGNLSVSLLTIRNAPDEGLYYRVPANAIGTKKVTLVGVNIHDNDGHGVHVDDQFNNTNASLEVRVIGSHFKANGFSVLDRDGLRVDEGGVGKLNFVVSLTRVESNGGDGIELDEKGVGDAVFDVTGTLFTENGGFNTAVDPDDGMDVDEADEGDLVGKVVASAANTNREEGWDFNENDLGDLRVDMLGVQANGNVEEGVDLEEDDGSEGTEGGGGDLIANLTSVTADGNLAGNAGLKFREYGLGNVKAAVRGAQARGNKTAGILVREENDGSLEATIERATATGNTGPGIRVREDAVGNLAATIERSTTDGNTADGIEFDENSDGDLTAAVNQGSSSNNTGAGIRADEGGSGGGSLTLVGPPTLDGNAGGAVASNVPVL